MAIERISGEREVLTEREQEFKDALEDMVEQFAYRGEGHGNTPPSMFTGGLSALEHAFGVLGWPDPKYFPDSSCYIVGCQKWPQSGNPLSNGDYWSLCSDHRAEFENLTRNGIPPQNAMKKKRGRGYNQKERTERLRRFRNNG